jgi:hypothetical protein
MFYESVSEMGGVDHQQSGMFSYLSPEERVQELGIELTLAILPSCGARLNHQRISSRAGRLMVSVTAPSWLAVSDLR